jgi:hypothetical protein
MVEAQILSDEISNDSSDREQPSEGLADRSIRSWQASIEYSHTTQAEVIEFPLLCSTSAMSDDKQPVDTGLSLLPTPSSDLVEKRPEKNDHAPTPIPETSATKDEASVATIVHEKSAENVNSVTSNAASESTSSTRNIDSIRPKFTTRLTPNINANQNERLQLEVHFFGQPEPKV